MQLAGLLVLFPRVVRLLWKKILERGGRDLAGGRCRGYLVLLC